MTLTRALLEDYVALRDITPAAKAAVAIALADGLSVMVAASGLEPAVAPMLAYASASGAGPSTLIGTSRRVSPVMAALGNGALAHAIDFEDTFEEGKIHPNASLIPAVLALAEAEGATGAEVIRALALGCDFACRLSLALDGGPAERGWYYPPILSGLGATLGCCLLLDLDADTALNALGLFAAQFMLADELKRSPLSHLRAVRESLAARAAVEAALLARAGVVAVVQPLEGPGGVFPILTGNGPRQSAFAGIGRHFYGPEVGVKQWPSCRGTHSAIVAAQRLRNRGVAPSDLTQVTVSVSPPNDMLFVPRQQRIAPRTAIDAKFSIPFVFATALEHGAVDLASFTPERLTSADTLKLASRIHMDASPLPPGIEAVYTLRIANGTSLTEIVNAVPGLRAADTKLEAIAPKLQACLAAGRKPVDCRELLAAVTRLETDSPGDLMRLF
ncbi:MmgE/PrpD family protein [Devosia albogilva]|uniref:MmgE/PrpD family protein n=1 Tax=Devosia albogilva TaxID=429726 RepID=A0ABW5QHU1_9HYPH